MFKVQCQQNLQPIVVDVLEGELLVDVRLALLGDGYRPCLDPVLNVWSQFQLDAHVAARKMC